jgi:hypothetical protein
MSVRTARLQFTPLTDATRISTVVAGETGTTGIREAVVTAHLMQEGRMTIETYKSSWACDPYDPAYRAPSNVPLRFISDDVVYDRMFRGHPSWPLKPEVGNRCTIPEHGAGLARLLGRPRDPFLPGSLVQTCGEHIAQGRRSIGLNAGRCARQPRGTSRLPAPRPMCRSTSRQASVQNQFEPSRSREPRSARSLLCERRPPSAHRA